MLLSCFSAPLLCLITALCLCEDGTSEIFHRRGCPFCPPYICIPVEVAQWILPLGVFSQEPLRDSAGKLQRCLAHAVPVFHYRSSMPFFYLFLVLGSDTQMMLLIQISAGHWGLKLNTHLQTLCFLFSMVRDMCVTVLLTPSAVRHVAVQSLPLCEQLLAAPKLHYFPSISQFYLRGISHFSN